MEWRGEVMRSPKLSNATKLALLAMYDHMDEEGRYGAGRERIAESLGLLSLQRVSARCSEAVERGFLSVVRRGGYGRSTAYQASIGSVVTEPDSRQLADWLTEPISRQLGDTPDLPVDIALTEPISRQLGVATEPISRQLGPVPQLSPSAGTSKVTADSNHVAGAPSGATEALVPMDESPIIPSPEPLAPRHLTAPRTGPDYEQERQRQLAELDRLIAQENS
jgi:hypothetical protein